MIWLLILASAVGFLFVCLLLEQLLFEREPAPRIGQPVKAAPPPLPRGPSWGRPHSDIHVPGPGRHRRPGPTT